MDSHDIYRFVSMVKGRHRIFVCAEERLYDLLETDTWYFVCVDSHWLLLKTSTRDKFRISEFFDSYGSTVLPSIVEFDVNCFVNTVNVQRLDDNYCGFYSVLYILLRLSRKIRPSDCIKIAVSCSSLLCNPDFV